MTPSSFSFSGHAGASLQQQVALITGASSGIGEITAEALAKEGMNLVLSARREEKLAEIKSRLAAQYPDIEILALPGDVSKAEDAKRVVEETLAHFRRLDVLINNAGVASKLSLLQEASIEEIDRIIDVNLKGAIYMMKYALMPMVSQSSGAIINLNSVAGKTAYPYWSTYCASKFGLKAITEAVAEEQFSNNIKVVGIYAGAVDTPLWNGLEVDHQPKREGMLDAETIAESIVFILKQPAKVFIPEMTVKPLKPAL